MAHRKNLFFFFPNRFDQIYEDLQLTHIEKANKLNYYSSMTSFS